MTTHAQAVGTGSIEGSPIDEVSPAPLEEAVIRCIADLDAAMALHRDTLATVSVERSALSKQLAQADTGLDTSPLGSDHHRRLAAAAEQIRVRLRAADTIDDIAARALADARRQRALLIGGAPSIGVDDSLHGGDHGRQEARPRQLFQIIEDERMRIARDMHDGPAQLLANLVLKAEIVERLLDHDPGMVRNELVEFKAIVRHALEETRQLIFDLRPMTLDDLGLIPTLRKFLADFEERWDIPCHFQVLGVERRASGDAEAAIFRIVQEACTNARKHAMASAIDVTVSVSPRRISVTIKDEGRGFDVAATEAKARLTNHLGLTSMRERASLSGAVLDVVSAPGQGTEVHVSITA